MEPAPVCCPLPGQCAEAGSQRRHDGRGNSGLQRFRVLSQCQAGWSVSLALTVTALCQTPRAIWIRSVSSVRSRRWRCFRGSGAPPNTSKAGKTPLCGHCGRPGFKLRQVSPAQLEARCSF